MKKVMILIFLILSAIIGIQQNVVEAAEQKDSGKIYYMKGSAFEGMAEMVNSTISYNILNGRMSCVSPVVDTTQDICYDSGVAISCPFVGDGFYGQDAQYSGRMPSYTDNGDGTVTDNVTGLMWQQSPDMDDDGDIDAADKMSFDSAVAGAETCELGGYSDWRLPTIKELYSLMDFRGLDPSGYEEGDEAFLVPFIDTRYFDFSYGDTDAGERLIDSQYASNTLYSANTEDGGENNLLFGVNFADGHIKGYGLSLFGQDKTFFVTYVRGYLGYGQNQFKDNRNGTITDRASQLMWSKDDSGAGLNWEEALAWVEEMNTITFLGYNDWRLPNIKELQGLVDYDRSPDATDSAAIDPIFNVTSITNEAEELDYPCYWSGTTHANWTDSSGSHGAYVAFGRAMGYMSNADPVTGETISGWVDVHGAGAQRSDPKVGDPDDYPQGYGPQGDAIRIYNYARLVRDLSKG